METDKDAKICPKCKELKPILEFSKSRWLASGYAIVCRKCVGKRKNEIESEKRLKRLEMAFQITDTWQYVCRVCGKKYGSRFTAAHHIGSKDCPRNWK